VVLCCCGGLVLNAVLPAKKADVRTQNSAQAVAPHHVADPDFSESYDRDTSMTRVGNHPDARFITVTIADRVLRYQRNLKDGGVSESKAIATVKADLPSDVV
jgi:hypothetical protein